MASIVFAFAGPKAFAFFGVCFSAWSTLVKSSVFKYFLNWLITYYGLAGVVCVLADFVFVFLNLSVAQSGHPYLTPNVNQDPLTFTWLEISVYKVWIHCIKVEFKTKCSNVLKRKSQLTLSKALSWPRLTRATMGGNIKALTIL